jgi:hypothetical protein
MNLINHESNIKSRVIKPWCSALGLYDFNLINISDRRKDIASNTFCVPSFFYKSLYLCQAGVKTFLHLSLRN